jgi:hypothetical protein
MANSLTPAFDLTVASKQGVFTLFGTVPREAARCGVASASFFL